MRLFLFALFICTLTYSCDKPFRTTSPEEEEVKTVAAVDTIVVDTIFLGFRFGMTEEEVTQHFRELIKEKVVYVVGRDETFTYDMALERSSYQATFSSEYFEGKLSQLKMMITHDNIVLDNPYLVYSSVVRLMMEKYGLPTERTENKLTDCESWKWRRGNLEVEVACNLDDGLLIYQDTRIDLAKDSIQDANRQKTIDML